MNSDERFAIAQALHNAVAEAVKTKTPGNLRAEADEASKALYRETGGKSRDILLCGAKVGEMRVETESRWKVTDPEAYATWCRSHDAMDGEEELDWTRLAPDDYWRARNWLKEHYPQMFVLREWPMEPSDEWLVHVDGQGVDNETGEIVPGLEFGTVVTKTAVSGCKWDESRMNKAERKKFAPVSRAARGLVGGAFAALMAGEEER